MQQKGCNKSYSTQLGQKLSTLTAHFPHTHTHRLLASVTGDQGFVLFAVAVDLTLPPFSCMWLLWLHGYRQGGFDAHVVFSQFFCFLFVCRD